MTSGQDRERLKKLILKEEQDKIKRIQKRLDNPRLFSKNVGKALPEAFKRATHKSDEISRTMVPIVEDTIYKSVSRNPKRMADALFPVIAPAIRKAISEALRNLIKTLNHTLESSLTLRSLKWRFQSLITRRPYAEFVIANSLIYMVKELYLIHGETGILLKHISSDVLNLKNGDMISGMLTAIRDFVADSFHKDKGEGLDSIEVGDLTIWIEQGPKAILAAVIEGQPSEILREKLRHALEEIHAHYALELDEFNGEVKDFKTADAELKPCLTIELDENKKEKKSGFLGWLISLIILTLLLTFFIYQFEKNSRWNRFVEKARQEEGVVILDEGRKKGKYAITGMKDPLSTDPVSYLSEFGFETSDVVTHWQLYQSIDEGVVNKRINRFFQPSDSIRLEVKNGIIFVEGVASAKWINEINIYGKRFDGIRGIDISQATSYEEIKAKKIAGDLAKIAINFTIGSDQILPEELNSLRIIQQKLDTLGNLSVSLNKVLELECIGYSDETGDEAYNRILNSRRSESLLNELKKGDFELGNMKIKIGNSDHPTNHSNARKAFVNVIF